MSTYIFIITFIIINTLIIIYFNKLKSFIKINDYPNKRKMHKNPTPLLGGPMLFLNLTLFVLLVNFNVIDADLNLNLNVFYLYCFIIFSLGIVDDIYSISANKKLILFFLIFFSYFFFEKSILIENISLSFISHNININNFSFFFTAICFVAFLNAFNMFDGINLQSSTYSIFLSIFLFLSNSNLFFLMLIIFLIFFSYLNYLNKTFLGNSGSYLLPFIFSVNFILNHNFKNLDADLIFVLMSIPGFELIRLTFYRIFNGQHPFYPDRNHIHHIMLIKYSHIKTLVLLNLLIYCQLIIYYLFQNSLLSIVFGIIIYGTVIYNISKFK